MEAYRDLKKETFLTHEGYANPQGPGDHVIDGTKVIGGVVLRCSGSIQVDLVNNSIGEETLTLTAAMNTETGWFLRARALRSIRSCYGVVFTHTPIHTHTRTLHLRFLSVPILTPTPSVTNVREFFEI